MPEINKFWFSVKEFFLPKYRPLSIFISLPTELNFQPSPLRSISIDLLSSTQSLDDLLTSLEGTKYFELLEPHLQKDSVDLNSCVHSLDEHMANKTKRFSYLYPLSVLPVLDYLLKKEREVYNLRAIVRGKQAGLSNEIIEELVVV